MLYEIHTISHSGRDNDMKNYITLCRLNIHCNIYQYSVYLMVVDDWQTADKCVRCIAHHSNKWTYDKPM